MLTIYLSLIDTPEQRNRFEEIYYKYRYLMRYVAVDILHDEQLAEDAVHDAFIKILQNISRFEDAQSTRTKNFAVIIVRNISLNILKKRRREVLSEDDTEMERQAKSGSAYYGINSGNSAQDEFFSCYGIARIADAIGELSPPLRDALYLLSFEEMSPAEISSILDVSIDTVYKRIQRGRIQLMEILEKSND